MSTINEMSDDAYANNDYAGDYRSAEPPQVSQLPDSTITIGAPSIVEDPKLITIYTQSITPVSYQGDDIIRTFDIVFSVSCTCPETGNLSTYQVVKRIGVDRVKMAQDARNGVPISIVESKKPGPHISTADVKKLCGL